MSGATVIVESDSVGDWLGLIGVVAGVAITTAANWFQGNRHDRGERQDELDAATGQVIASATSVIILVERDIAARSATTGAPPRDTMGDESDWADKITRAIERLQIADQVVQRYGQKDSAQASGRIVSLATEFARNRGPGASAIDDAIASFAEIVHK
jgi:hypothetical protein